MKSRIDSILKRIQWLSLVVYCVLVIIMFINNDKSSLTTGIALLYIPIWVLTLMSINLYGVYYLDWGGKQFDRWINNWRRFFLLTKNKSTYIILCKIVAIFVLAVPVFLFIIFWDIITTIIRPYL